MLYEILGLTSFLLTLIGVEVYASKPQDDTIKPIGFILTLPFVAFVTISGLKGMIE